MARIRYSQLVALLGLVGALLLINVPLVTAQSNPQVQSDARRLDQVAQEVDDAAAAANWTAARADWREFGDLWLDVEDGFRDLSRDGYARIENNMVAVGDALRVDSPDQAATRRAVQALRDELAPFVAGTANSAAQPKPVASGQGLDGLMDTLDRAIAAADRRDAEGAFNNMRSFQTQWLDVEGQVKTRSAQTYRSTEDNMARASSLLRANPPAFADALVTMHAMRQELAPLVEQPARYGATAGASRELVEGLTGLVAAVMLLYVSYWLHSKSSLHAWQTYVRERTSAALAGGGMFSLSLISFLSVFREGAETSLFYIGIAPSIAGQDLALGIGLGTLALTVIGVVMLVFGLRIPLRPFFLVSSVLLYYLAFKFIGTGLHALQVAGVLPATPVAVPSWDPIGLFPTWETTLPQLALLVIAACVLILKS